MCENMVAAEILQRISAVTSVYVSAVTVGTVKLRVIGAFEF